MGANFTDISAGQDGENIGLATLMKQGANSMMDLEQEKGQGAALKSNFTE